MKTIGALIDRLIDHVTDRVLARIEARRTITVVQNINVENVSEFDRQLKRRRA